jgi:hypothetical protein
MYPSLSHFAKTGNEWWRAAQAWRTQHVRIHRYLRFPRCSVMMQNTCWRDSHFFHKAFQHLNYTVHGASSQAVVSIQLLEVSAASSCLALVTSIAIQQCHMTKSAFRNRLWHSHGGCHKNTQAHRAITTLTSRRLERFSVHGRVSTRSHHAAYMLFTGDTSSSSLSQTYTLTLPYRILQTCPLVIMASECLQMGQYSDFRFVHITSLLWDIGHTT